MLDGCDIQSYSNAIVMIIAALFTGIRMSRCRTIDTPCWKCEREIVNEPENNV